MELRKYWDIIYRRWWLALGMAVLVALASYLLQPQTRESYASTVRLAALPDEAALRATFGTSYPPSQERYYGVLLTELFWDDASSQIKSPGFFERVRREVSPLAGGRSVAGSFETKKEHQAQAVTATADTPEIAQQLANTAARLLIQPPEGSEIKGFVDSRRITVILLDSASPPVPASAVRGSLNLGLRALLGLVAGIALAFLLEYLDDTLRDEREAREALGLPVLGEIPTTA